MQTISHGREQICLAEIKESVLKNYESLDQLKQSLRIANAPQSAQANAKPFNSVAINGNYWEEMSPPEEHPVSRKYNELCGRFMNSSPRRLTFPRNQSSPMHYTTPIVRRALQQLFPVLYGPVNEPWNTLVSEPSEFQSLGYRLMRRYKRCSPS